MTTRAFVRREATPPAANRHATAISPREPATRPSSVRAQLAAARDEIARLEALREADALELGALRRAVEARDTFIAIAGCELRNPMGAIALGVSNLAYQVKRAAADVPAWIGERLESLDRRTSTFVRRSTTLLDVSRLASQKLAIVPAPANLSTIVEAAVADLAPEASRTGCVLRVDAEPGVTGAWDASALDQIAHNLLSNAVRFGAGAPVDVSLRSAGESAVLEVRDGGPGIADVDRNRMFDSFEQAVAPREGTGFGLGLWITRQLVRAHEGEVDVSSTPGAGSTFTVTLPRRPPVPKRSTPPLSPLSPREAGPSPPPRK